MFGPGLAARKSVNTAIQQLVSSIRSRDGIVPQGRLGCPFGRTIP